MATESLTSLAIYATCVDKVQAFLRVEKQKKQRSKKNGVDDSEKTSRASVL